VAVQKCREVLEAEPVEIFRLTNRRFKALLGERSGDIEEGPGESSPKSDASWLSRRARAADIAGEALHVLVSGAAPPSRLARYPLFA